MLTKEQIETGLQHYYCSENWYRHSMGKFTYTDGIKYLATACEAYWLIDLIASLQTHKAIKSCPECQDFQFWTLNVTNGVGKLVCEWDSGHVVLTQKIPHTDFPLPQVKLWLSNGVLYLPSEH